MGWSDSARGHCPLQHFRHLFARATRSLSRGSLTDSEISNVTNLTPETTEITLRSGPGNLRNVRIDGAADIGK